MEISLHKFRRKESFMKSIRGIGNVYQPTYRGKDGKRRTCATWWIVYHVNGRRIREDANTTNRAQAVRLLKRRTGDAALGKPVGPELGRSTLDDLLAMVEADYRANSRKSIDRVQHAAKRLREFFRGDRKVREISTDRITAYAAHRLDCGAKPATANYEVAVLRRGFRLGVRAGKVGARPEIQMLHVNNARKGFFEHEQYRGVVAHLPAYLKPVAIAAYITGWRARSELLTRQWRHVDFARGWLRLEPGESKNGEGREFPFTPELRTILEQQRLRVRAIEQATGKIIPWVFVHPPGEGRAPAGSRISDFRGAWANACRDAGVPGRLVHDFRRTAVRNLERAGVPRSAAMKMTGHKTEAVYRRYAITDSAMLQEAALKLAALHDAEEKRQSNAKVDPILAVS
jgi:integrase